eukprot:gnl/MRDRNA2_/MRDRNA2_84790_c0_seq1.p1 gnl/MRDRNA2_/MRDRNA2_84790_c0~~gnl/MRDRNA2_/MRDRNA2_84790_c0_seq1.p1  ORF type:complete len:259 (+),score=38.53 gnl/MRDRNA2_/MRDRNA2_84790_c0_seq1:60-836(+)
MHVGAYSCKNCVMPWVLPRDCALTDTAALCVAQRVAWPKRRHKSRVEFARVETCQAQVPVCIHWPLSSGSPPHWILLRNFVSEDERQQLLTGALKQWEAGGFCKNPMGPHRYFRKVDQTGGPDAFLSSLTVRMENALRLRGVTHDPALGRVISIIEAGGYVHPHRDDYPQGSGLEKAGHLRANIVVQKDDGSGAPIIAGQTLPCNECDAWAFMASATEHSTQMVKGPRQRIVYGFGWIAGERSLTHEPDWPEVTFSDP